MPAAARNSWGCFHLSIELSDRFRAFAAENLILMEADYRGKKQQPAEVKKQNEALKEAYLENGYPAVFLLDAEGKKLSEDLGALKGGTEAYFNKLKELLAAKK